MAKQRQRNLAWKAKKKLRQNIRLQTFKSHKRNIYSSNSIFSIKVDFNLKPLFDSIQFNTIKISRDILINKRLDKIKSNKTNPPTIVSLNSSMSQLLINKNTIQPTIEHRLCEPHNIFNKNTLIAHKKPSKFIQNINQER